MTYALARYTQNIAMIIIFTTLVHLIMPSGSFEKYIKLILGLIVIITILTPVHTILFKNKPNYTDILKRYQLDIEQTTAIANQSMFLDMQKELILDNYNEKISTQMTELIEKGNGVTVDSLKIYFNEDVNSSEYGKIIGIYIIANLANDKADKNKIKVPQIKVGTKDIEKNNKQIKEGQIEKNIKTCLIDFYNLSDVNIDITVQKNS